MNVPVKHPGLTVVQKFDAKCVGMLIWKGRLLILTEDGLYVSQDKPEYLTRVNLVVTPPSYCKKAFDRGFRQGGRKRRTR